MSGITTTWKPQNSFHLNSDELKLRQDYWRLEEQTKRKRNELINAVSSRVKQANPFILSIPDLVGNFEIYETSLEIHSIILNGKILTEVLDVGETQETPA